MQGADLYIIVKDDDSEQINRPNDFVDYFVITINSTEICSECGTHNTSTLSWEEQFDGD